MKFEHVIGDIFRSGCSTLVNPVNCKGVMGKGLAEAFRLKYPEIYGPYKYMCHKKYLAPGKLHTVRTNDGRLVVNFPTKDDWMSGSEMSYVADGLQALAELLVITNIRSIAIPKLGCGCGGLKWKKVHDLIYDVLGNLNLIDNDVCSVGFIGQREILVEIYGEPMTGKGELTS